jgi:anti-sigma regulatory factor (Ser/Thr protein kinase)
MLTMPKGRLSPDRTVGPNPHAPSQPDELNIAASGADVRRALEWLDTACLRRDVPQTVAEQLVLCLHEVLANIIAHGGASALAAPIALALEFRTDIDGIQAIVTVSDAGKAFDPRSVPQRTPPRTLDEAEPGGMGLVMIRRCADWLGYRYDGGRNHFTFGVRWSEP